MGLMRTTLGELIEVALVICVIVLVPSWIVYGVAAVIKFFS